MPRLLIMPYIDLKALEGINCTIFISRLQEQFILASGNLFENPLAVCLENVKIKIIIN